MPDLPELKVKVTADFTQLRADLDVITKQINDLKAAAADAGVSIASQVEAQFNQAFNAQPAQQPGAAPAPAPAPVDQPANQPVEPVVPAPAPVVDQPARSQQQPSA